MFGFGHTNGVSAPLSHGYHMLDMWSRLAHVFRRVYYTLGYVLRMDGSVTFGYSRQLK